MNLFIDWRITLITSILSLFMTIATGGFDFLVFFLVLYYIALREFDKEIVSG